MELGLQFNPGAMYALIYAMRGDCMRVLRVMHGVAVWRGNSDEPFLDHCLPSI